MYIKYGRVVKANEDLKALLNRFTDTNEEILILEVYALELLQDTKSYGKASPLLERLLSLNISDDLRKRAHDFLEYCNERLSLVPIEADINNPEIIHFMETVREGRFLKFDAHPNNLHQFALTRNLEEAKWLAWNQEIEPPFESWNGTRALAVRQMGAYSNEKGIMTMNLEDKLIAEMTSICERRVSGEMMNFFDDIYGDLTEIAIGKAIGYETHLYKNAWSAYQLGAFPCGWKGEYPEGKLCVFLP